MAETRLPSPDPALPSGFPDVAMLEQLANQFFRALPGENPSPATPAVGGIGASPASMPSPRLAPALPVIPAPAPLSSIPATADPNIGSLGHQHGPHSGGLYLENLQRGKVSSFPAAIPSLGQELPNEAELRRLLASPQTAQSNAPAGGGSAPYFLKSSVPAQPTLVHAAPQPAFAGSSRFDANLARRDFPILAERVNGKPLIWLDNAATTQKPRAVIDRLSYFYEHENSNIHRAAHTLAGRATDAYEAAREQVRRFLNAGSVDEIVFVRGATEAINLVADTWGRANIGQGDEIIVTHLEHHANIVPWFRLAKAVGATLKVAPVDDNGDIILDAYAALLGPRTKLVSLTQVSNALGVVTPAPLMVAMAHAAGARVLVDGAQSVSHMRADMKALDADWFVFSGHKVFGPTGIGALYGKKHVLEDMPAYQSGGNMIADVTFEEIRYQPPPNFFEAGTGNIADAVGLGAALAYVEKIGIETIAAHEHALIEDCTRQLARISGVRILGNPKERAGVVSFVMDGMKTEDVGKALSNDGIAVRSGHHCAQPILRRFGVETSVRPSFALYNTHADIDALVRSLYGIRSRP